MGDNTIWDDYADAHRDLFEYLEPDYNRERIHSALGYVTPAQLELQTVKLEARGVRLPGGVSARGTPQATIEVSEERDGTSLLSPAGWQLFPIQIIGQRNHHHRQDGRKQ